MVKTKNLTTQVVSHYRHRAQNLVNNKTIKYGHKKYLKTLNLKAIDISKVNKIKELIRVDLPEIKNLQGAIIIKIKVTP